jgi:hypothetical protein
MVTFILMDYANEFKVTLLKLPNAKGLLQIKKLEDELAKHQQKKSIKE